MARKAKKFDYVCAGPNCGKPFNMPSGPGKTPHVVPSIWPDMAPTVRFCATRCYEDWLEIHRPRALSKNNPRTTKPPKSKCPVPPIEFPESADV